MQADSAPCLSAAAANEDDRILVLCSALIDNEKTARSDRIKALLARAGAFQRKETFDRAISDYDAVLRLDQGCIAETGDLGLARHIAETGFASRTAPAGA